jgi:transposase InsO family protein
LAAGRNFTEISLGRAKRKGVGVTVEKQFQKIAKCYVKIDASSYSAICFLREVIRLADFKIQAIKTDNGSCFTNRYTGYNKSTDPLNPRLHEFDMLCQRLGIPHYLIDPGKPQQNSFVERSHRTDQEKFYDENIFKSFKDLKQKLRMWNIKYNNTKHCGLDGKTPNQMLRLLT